jgi:hypothetical protein
MADAPTKDSLALFRDMVSQWERQVNAIANQTMGSEEFSGAMNQAMNLSLKFQQTMAQTMSTYLATLNLPSRQDILTIGERVEACEGHLARLVTLMERDARDKRAGDAGEKSPAMPPRTKRPPGTNGSSHVAKANDA